MRKGSLYDLVPTKNRYAWYGQALTLSCGFSIDPQPCSLFPDHIASCCPPVAKSAACDLVDWGNDILQNNLFPEDMGLNISDFGIPLKLSIFLIHILSIPRCGTEDVRQRPWQLMSLFQFHPLLFSYNSWGLQGNDGLWVSHFFYVIFFFVLPWDIETFII